MYDIDNSVSYLGKDATQEPTQQKQPQMKTKPRPTWLEEGDPRSNMNQRRGMKMGDPNENSSPTNSEENLQWQDYTYRAGVSPYSSHYDKPAPLHQKYEDVLGSTGESGSAFKTGLLLSSLLLLGSVGGYSLEKKIQKKAPKGYGAILGSLGAIGIYYVGAKTLSSGIMEGAKGLGGFAIPMLPIFFSMYQGKKLDNTTAMISAGIGLLGSSYVLITNITR